MFVCGSLLSTRHAQSFSTHLDPSNTRLSSEAARECCLRRQKEYDAYGDRKNAVYGGRKNAVYGGNPASALAPIAAWGRDTLTYSK